MAELRVVLDQLVAPVPGGVGRYTSELTKALIATAPEGSTVSGFVSAVSPERREEIHAELPGLAELNVSRLDRRALALAWAHGFTIPWATGIVHSPSPLAPLFPHERVGPGASQVAVTVQDTVPWTNPEALTPHGVAWHKRIIQRAERYADAIVVTTHAVADELADILRVGDRIRVVPAGVSAVLAAPPDADDRARRLRLPARYVLAVGSIEPRKGLPDLIAAMTDASMGDVPLVHVGPAAWGDLELGALAADAGLPESRMRDLGRLDDEDLAVVLRRASVFVMPSRAEGFGLPLLEAMSAGTPAVYTDVPAMVEVSAGAGLQVPRHGDLVPALAEAISSVLDDSVLAERLSVLGRDRAGAFSWRDSAEKVWQLHADL